MKKYSPNQRILNIRYTFKKKCSSTMLLFLFQILPYPDPEINTSSENSIYVAKFIIIIQDKSIITVAKV